MQTINYIPTSEKVTVNNYPYGYTLRTTLYDSVDFCPKKGFRRVSQTINPKNGKLNAPKKSTYAPILLRYINEDGHIKADYVDFYELKNIPAQMEWLAQNFSYFTDVEMQFIYASLVNYLRVTIHAMVIYCGSNKDSVIELFKPSLKIAMDGVKAPQLNFFSEIKAAIDIEAIEATKKPDYSPFKNQVYSMA